MNLNTLGNRKLLDTPSKLALFCSVKCPASIILKTYDLAQQLKDQDKAIISGFHSPIEKEVLVTLLRGTAPIIMCPARSIHNLRIPSAWQPAIDSGRMLIASPFDDTLKRATQKTAILRNQLIAELADEIFIAYASVGGKTESFARDLLINGHTILTFDSDHTQNLRDLGAQILPEL